MIHSLSFRDLRSVSVHLWLAGPSSPAQLRSGRKVGGLLDVLPHYINTAHAVSNICIRCATRDRLRKRGNPTYHTQSLRPYATSKATTIAGRALSAPPGPMNSLPLWHWTLLSLCAPGFRRNSPY